MNLFANMEVNQGVNQEMTIYILAWQGPYKGKTLKEIPCNGPKDRPQFLWNYGECDFTWAKQNFTIYNPKL